VVGLAESGYARWASNGEVELNGEEEEAAFELNGDADAGPGVGGRTLNSGKLPRVGGAVRGAGRFAYWPFVVAYCAVAYCALALEPKCEFDGELDAELDLVNEEGGASAEADARRGGRGGARKGLLLLSFAGGFDGARIVFVGFP
jgi:hypothetical protein